MKSIVLGGLEAEYAPSGDSYLRKRHCYGVRPWNYALAKDTFSFMNILKGPRP